jgi:hypothetical protein
MFRPSAEQARQSLLEHVVVRATEARLKRGGLIDRAEVIRMLEDRSVVRYPMGVRFDAAPLRCGEFACLEALGEHPSDGFCLFLHPMFETSDDLLPLLVAYYIPSVNYGEVATRVEAEAFGSTLLGLEREAYYRILCSVADSTPPAGTEGHFPG